MNGAMNLFPFIITRRNPTVKGGYNHWTGLLDWTTGLDYWTGLLDSPKLQNTPHSLQN